MLRKYLFTAQVTVSATTTVVARSEEEAREIAERRPACIDTSFHGDQNESQFTIEEADGTPENIRLESTEAAGDGDEAHTE